MNEKVFPMLAKTFKGLEDVLRDELIALGAKNVEIGNRMVAFEGDLEMMYKANFCCRTALRILKPIIKFTASDPDELYEIASEIEWNKYMTADTTFAIDPTVNSEGFRHSKFASYRLKDSIVDYFSNKYGKRPSVRVTGYDMLFNLHISDDRVTISLDSSGAPLNQRGYRVDSTIAPLNEVLAAGIIMKTGWRGDCNFVDPMCGSGTFLIEAALIASNTWPGIYRKSFAFEKWDDFDSELFEKIYNDDSEEKEFKFKIYGADIDPEVIMTARRNIKEARVDQFIDLKCMSFEEWTEAPKAGILITNPPYGERLKPEKIADLYSSIGSTLKRHFAGYHAWILGYREEHFTAIGLKPSVKYPLLNGSLECSLREYVLFDGKYNDFKFAGGSVQNKDFNRRPKAGTRRMTDKEWQEETRKFDSPKSDHRRKSDGKPRSEHKPRRFDDKPRKFDDKPRRFEDKQRKFDDKPRRNDDSPRMRSRKTWKKPNS